MNPTRDYDALLRILTDETTAILDPWLLEVTADPSARSAMQPEARALITALRNGLAGGGDPTKLAGPSWDELGAALDALSHTRAQQGRTAGETSVFVLALKKPLFALLQRRLGDDAAGLVSALWTISTLVDQLAQRTVTSHQQSREDVIRRQQQELLELSTPVIKLWDGVLAVPMIGTLDSSRTQIVMETLLEKIVETESSLAIIDITGVPTVDTLVAQHLLKTVSAIRLMGADCIISGIRPQIAQTIVHLGISLDGVSTRATLASALSLALSRTGHTVSRSA
jgi:rsbT co-antagonist protein RsbR